MLVKITIIKWERINVSFSWFCYGDLLKHVPPFYCARAHYFEIHLAFAEKYHKPLIIHAVKSWNEIIIYLKRAKVPFILHGYTGGKELTKQLIDLEAYFSIGKSVLRMPPRFQDAIQLIPLSALFLETDDSLTDIREIYDEVSKIRNISLEELKIQINRNFKSLFIDNPDSE